MTAFDPTKFGAVPVKAAGSFDPAAFGAKPVELTMNDKLPGGSTTRPNLAKIESENAASTAESKKFNSFTGIAKETGKNIVKNLFSSEISIGETLGQSLATGKVAEDLTAANETNNTTKVNLIKQIRANKVIGKDNTRLIDAYNSLVGQDEPKVEDIVPNITKTNLQVAGDLGGVALDVLSAGSYGKATKGAKSFKLLKTEAKPLVVEAVTESTPVKGLFAKETAKKVATGGVTGYGYDVVQNAKEGKTGGSLFVPGFGTAIGVGVPIAEGAITSTVKGFKELNKIQKTYRGKIDDSMRDEAVSGLQSDWSKFFDEKKSTRNKYAKEIFQGKDPAEELAAGGYVPKIVNNGLDTTDIIETTTNQIGDRMDAVDNYLAQFKDKKGTLTQLENDAKQIMQNDPNIGADLIKSEKELSGFFDSYRKKYGEEIDPTIMNNIRKEMNKKTSSYKTDDFIIDTADAVAKATRSMMDEAVDSPIVREINSEIGRIGSARKMAKIVNGDKVKFGAMGRWFARTIGSVIGSKGNSVIGPTLGAIGGDQVVSILQGMAFTNPVRSRILKTVIEDKTLMNQILSETSEAQKAYLQRELKRASSNLLEAPKSGVKNSISSGKTLYATPGGAISGSSQEAVDAAAGELASKNMSRYASKATPDIVQAKPKAKTSILRYSEKTEPYVAPEKMPVIDMGKTLKSKSSLPTVKYGESQPDVFMEKVSKVNKFKDSDLIESAKKFDNEDRFIKSQGDEYYHGTSAKGFEQFKGVTYMTSIKDEAVPFSQDKILGGGKDGGQSRVIDVIAKPGKTKDVTDNVTAFIFEEDPNIDFSAISLDDVIAEEVKKAKKEGFRYLTFEHPGVKNEMFSAKVSIYPKEDLVFKDKLKKVFSEAKKKIITKK